MAIGVSQTGGGKEIVGCVDPQASNYNPLATNPCGPLGPPTPDLFGTYTSGCCNYPATNVTGCLDPQANNYDPSAVVACGNCCTYGQPSGNGFGVLDFGDIVINPGGGGTDTGTGDSTTTYCSELLFNFSTDGVVSSINGPIKEECCTEEFVGQPVFWDGEYCNIYTDTGENTLCESFALGLISQAEFQSRVLCVDCDNFAWWDNLYTTINGHSLQDINPDLWDFLIDLITVNTDQGLFADGSFYIDTLTGEPIIGQECCSRLPNSNYTSVTSENGEEISACLCNVQPETELVCECLKSVDTFISLGASLQGRALLLNVETLTSLGLTTQEAQFVIDNLFNINDFNGDGTPDSINARILISNVLYITGGFYVCYQSYLTGNRTHININGSLNLNSKDITIPVGVTEQKCTDLGGFYDGVLCYCEPIGECNLSLTDLTVTTELDLFNQNITYVTFNGTSISEECCLRIASDNNLPWVYEQYQGVFNCFTKDPNPCLPLEFTLNSELIKPMCDTPLNVSASFYFNVPENPCVEVDPGDDDVIDVDPGTEPCLLTFDENNNLIDYNTTTVKGKPLVVNLNFNDSQPTTEPCCFNPISPISANLVVKDSNNIILQTSSPVVFNELETWFDLTMQFNPLDYTGTTEGYSVALQFTSGLNCCCTYDIFIDNIKFECLSAQTITEILKNECPGFEIVPVIDNKKSWVYNPGLPGYSNIVDQGGNKTDENVIKGGEFGLIQGHGVLNRTFAPSPDAELPWRYTDYFNQSSVVEKHSNLVLNSKELFLTFDMCSDCCLEYKPCPDGYTLSAGTDTCYKYVVCNKQFQDGDCFDFQDGESYDFMDF